MKISLKQISCLLIISIFLSSCASVYLAPNAKQKSYSHEVIAIIPPNVSIVAKKKDTKELIEEAQKTSSLETQQEIYRYMLMRKSKGQMKVNIQDLNKTNALLNRNDVASLTPEEICTLLNVDAIISTDLIIHHPFSKGAAVALLFIGVAATTNQAKVSMSIKGCENKELFWKYDHTYSGGVFTTPSQLIQGLMRNASKKMPYML